MPTLPHIARDQLGGGFGRVSPVTLIGSGTRVVIAVVVEDRREEHLRIGSRLVDEAGESSGCSRCRLIERR